MAGGRLSDDRATPDPDAAEPDVTESKGLGLSEEPSGRRPVQERPLGLPMTPSARRRLELVLDRSSSMPPPSVTIKDSAPLPPPPSIPREALGKEPARKAEDEAERKDKDKRKDKDERKDKRKEPTRPPDSMPPPDAKPHARFGKEEAKNLRGLAVWVLIAGTLAAITAAIAGAGALLGRSGPIASVMIGVMASILAGSIGVWLLSAGLSFWRAARQPSSHLHRFVDGLGLVRTALLLKSILLFSALALGCFSFSIAAALLLML